ncbi:MAG: lipid A biosynthesis acyltransferase [Burkholderiales bacterium]|nr:MAG: lipid A biosynthesis acyltransferase [Burkholderiales bacterium]
MIGDALARVGLALVRAVVRMPYPWVRALASGLGALLYVVVVPRRRIALVNLGLCFPQWTEARRRAVARAHFRLYARSFFDRFIVWEGSEQRVREFVRLEHFERFEACRGRPLIVLVPHFLGLDAAGTRLSLQTRVASMYADQSNRILNRAVRAGRARFNDPVLLSRREGLRGAVRALRSGMPLYFLPDMDLGPRDAVFVPFFGVPAATVTSVARLARITGAVVLPLVARIERDRYVAAFHPPWADCGTDPPEAVARRMNAFIEQRVLEMPAQYLWTHRRFKTRPPGEASPYAAIGATWFRR